MAGPQRTEMWGLTPCPPQRHCDVCAVLGEHLSELRRLRDLYVEGYPEWVLAQSFGLAPEALHRHAWGKNWHRRRAYNSPARESLLFELILSRLRETWHLVTPDTPDRMLALMGKFLQGTAKTRNEER